MSEQLPDGLQLAIKYCGVGVGHQTAIDAIRDEHARRLSLQHHAADMAQRVADLEAENIGLSDAFESEGYVLLLNYIKELDAAEDMCGCPGAIAAQLLRDQQKEIAELEAERANTAMHVASIAGQLGDDALQVDDIAVRVLGLVAERDELSARLAEIEAQEPAIVEAGELRIGFGDTGEAVWLKLSRNIPLGTKLYAAPVTAQAVPDEWRLVPLRLVTAEMVRAGEAAWYAKERDMRHPTPTEFPEGGPAEACFFAMVAAAPEHKA